MKNLRQFTLPLIFLGFIATYNQSCCRGNCDDEPIDTTQVYNDTIFVNNQFLKYWFFGEGSYWIYENNTDSGTLIDTATVVFSERYFSCQRGLCVENCYMKVRHTNPFFINYEGYNGDIQHFNNSLTSELRVGASDGTNLSFPTMISFPIKERDVFNNGNMVFHDSILSYHSFLKDSIFIQKTTNFGIHPELKREVEYVRLIGIISYSLPENSFWKLINYSLIRK